MIRSIALGVASLALLFASSTYAVVPDEDSAVSNNWKLVGREMRSLGGISDAAEFAAVMGRFHEAATANLDEVPSFMEAGTEAHADYLRGVEEFIAIVESAKALADAGDLDGAQGKVQALRDSREEWHTYFDLEEP